MENAFGSRFQCLFAQVLLRVPSSSGLLGALVRLRPVPGDLLEVRQEADERKRKAPAKRLPYKTFTASRGSEAPP